MHEYGENWRREFECVCVCRQKHKKKYFSTLMAWPWPCGQKSIFSHGAQHTFIFHQFFFTLQWTDTHIHTLNICMYTSSFAAFFFVRQFKVLMIATPPLNVESFNINHQVFHVLVYKSQSMELNNFFLLSLLTLFHAKYSFTEIQCNIYFDIAKQSIDKLYTSDW